MVIIIACIKRHSNASQNLITLKAKYLATKYLLKLYKTKNFPVTILRLYQAYGPYQDFNRLIPQAIINSLQNKKFNCTSGIQKKRFYLY